MERTKKNPAPAEGVRETQDGQELGIADAPEAGAACMDAVNGQIIGPENPEELLGCQDADEAELAEGVWGEYAVTAEGGLRLREGTGPNARVIAVLPQGAGVLSDGAAVGGWIHVRTGRLEGWMLAEFLEELPLPEWPVQMTEKLPYDAG